jgi:quercetin dioxygenase-like cupin family protein
MDITKATTIKAQKGKADWFTGDVVLEPIVDAPAPARVRASRVTFFPGARTAWHTHPLGQTLYVLSGVGRIQLLGGPVREILPGDRVWIGPEEKHWHGAAPGSTMTHVAIQENLGGVNVTWMEHVTDADYQAAPA